MCFLYRQAASRIRHIVVSLLPHVQHAPFTQESIYIAGNGIDALDRQTAQRSFDACNGYYLRRMNRSGGNGTNAVSASLDGNEARYLIFKSQHISCDYFY